MAKRHRQWSTVNPNQCTHTHTSPGTIGTVITVNSDEEATLSAVRLFPTRWLISLNVQTENYVAGRTVGQLWVACAVVLEDEGANGHHIINVTGIDRDDNMRWLWRQAIPLFDGAVPIGGSDDHCNSFALDWQFRGGKGGQLKRGEWLLFVSQWVDNPLQLTYSTIRLSAGIIELYGLRA